MVSQNGRQGNDISDGPIGFAYVFRALRGRNYRLFFIGQGISLIGTWMQQVAMSWLVYSMTNSAFLLGVVAFSSTIFSFILAPFTGVLVDRLNRHRIVVITQTLSMIQALVLTAVVMTGSAAVWNLILLSAVLGIINAVDMPTRQSFVVEMVDKKEDLSNAIALNSSLFNSARLIGPSVAGILVATIGEGLCFLLNGLSFIAVIACLLSMRIAPKPAGMEHPDVFKGMKEGLSYAFGFVPIRYIILLLSFASLVIMPYTVLLPVFARQILNGGANILGFLTTAAGVGALIGAIYMATRRSVVGLVKILVIASLIFGIGLIMLSFTAVLWLSLIAMSLAGFGMVVTMASCNTFLQSIADDDKRGRVMGFYVMAFMGLAPFGSLLYGGLASAVGTPLTLMIGGGLYMAGTILFAWKFSSVRAVMRDVYLKKGIISQRAD
jgi:MFS family permease